MRGLAFILLVLVVLGGGAAFLATRPASDLQPIQPSSAAALAATARVVATFKLAQLKAVLTRRQQPASVSLSDAELTSIADLWLSQNSSSIHNLTVHGTSGGVFQASAQADWNGFTLDVFEAGTVSFNGDGSLQPSVSEAKVGQLPLPAGLLNSLLAQGQPAFKPPDVLNLSLQPVEGGGLLSGSVAPAI